MDLSRVALRGRCLGVFRAPNPWEGGALDRWTVHVYSAVARSVVEAAAARLAARADRPEQLTPQRWPGRLAMNEAIGIESSDARHHLLPTVIEALCRNGTIAPEQLPAAIRQWEHRLAHSDFPLYLPRLLFKFLAPFFALVALVLIALRWHNGPSFDVLLWLAIPLLLPLVLWPAFALLWRAREARLRQAMAASMPMGRP